MTFGALAASKDVDTTMLCASVSHSSLGTVLWGAFIASPAVLDAIHKSEDSNGHCRVRTHRDLALLPDMGSLLPVEIARVDVIVVEHFMCPTYGGNEMKG